jgi:hypothetical protein
MHTHTHTLNSSLLTDTPLLASLTSSQIISYAHLLAPYTSRGPTWPPTHVGAFGERFLYPRSDQMNQGRLREVVVGTIGGVGEGGRVVEVDGRLEKVPQGE